MSVSVYFSQQQQQKCCVYLNLNRLFKIRKPEIRHLCIKLKYNVKIIIIIIIIIICTATAVSSVAIRGLIPKSRCGQRIEVQNQKWRCRLLHSVTPMRAAVNNLLCIHSGDPTQHQGDSEAEFGTSVTSSES